MDIEHKIAIILQTSSTGREWNCQLKLEVFNIEIYKGRVFSLFLSVARDLSKNISQLHFNHKNGRIFSGINPQHQKRLSSIFKPFFKSMQWVLNYILNHGKLKFFEQFSSKIEVFFFRLETAEFLLQLFYQITE